MSLLLNSTTSLVQPTGKHAVAVAFVPKLPLILAVLVVFILGILCATYIYRRYFATSASHLPLPSDLKIPSPRWGLYEVGQAGLALLAIILTSTTCCAVLMYVTHRDFADLAPIIIAIELLLRVIFFVGLLAFFRRRKIPLSDFFGTRLTPIIPALGLGIVFGLAVLPPVQITISAIELICRLFHCKPSEQPITELIMTTDSRQLLTLLVIFALLVAPVFEECFFRGFVYPAIKRHLGPWRSLTIVSAAFAISHFHLPSMVPLFILAFALGLAYELTGSLLVPITMHTLFNAVMMARLFYERAHP
jgi:membrane protease YdiL (CAAX protease family)